MYDELVISLRNNADHYMTVEGAAGLVHLLTDAADAIEERDKYALTIQHEMMAEAESHIALVERLNKQIDYLQKQVAYWQAQLTKSMCGEALADLEKHHWIPVKEQLPKMHEEVLACNEDYGDTGLGFSVVAVWDGSDWICAWDMESRLHFITHWMPLPKAPEPPKEEA